MVNNTGEMPTMTGTVSSLFVVVAEMEIVLRKMLWFSPGRTPSWSPDGSVAHGS